MSEEWVVKAGRVDYARRPTRAEAEAVRDDLDHRRLAEKFGLPVVVEQRVVSLEARSREEVDA